jgi:hypothetical protein
VFNSINSSYLSIQKSSKGCDVPIDFNFLTFMPLPLPLPLPSRLCLAAAASWDSWEAFLCDSLTTQPERRGSSSPPLELSVELDPGLSSPEESPKSTESSSVSWLWLCSGSGSAGALYQPPFQLGRSYSPRVGPVPVRQRVVAAVACLVLAPLQLPGLPLPAS